MSHYFENFEKCSQFLFGLIVKAEITLCILDVAPGEILSGGILAGDIVWGIFS